MSANRRMTSESFLSRASSDWYPFGGQLRINIAGDAHDVCNDFADDSRESCESLTFAFPADPDSVHSEPKPLNMDIRAGKATPFWSSMTNMRAESNSLYVQNQADDAVVIADMMMPLMDGPATIRVLRRRGDVRQR